MNLYESIKTNLNESLFRHGDFIIYKVTKTKPLYLTGNGDFVEDKSKAVKFPTRKEAKEYLDDFVGSRGKSILGTKFIITQLDEGEQLTEAKKFTPGDYLDDVSDDPYDRGLTEEDLEKNLNLKFTGYENMTKSEHEDFPECNARLNFDVYYKNTKVGCIECYGSTEDKPEEYFDQEIENIIENPFGMDFSKVKLD